jgi:hypothetical protein
MLSDPETEAFSGNFKISDLYYFLLTNEMVLQ